MPNYVIWECICQIFFRGRFGKSKSVSNQLKLHMYLSTIMTMTIAIYKTNQLIQSNV